MIKQLLFCLFSLAICANAAAQEHSLDGLIDKLEFEGRRKMSDSPDEYHDVALGVANHVYHHPLSSVDAKNIEPITTYLSLWMAKTEQFWFNFQVPDQSIAENPQWWMLYLACNVKYCLDNPEKGKVNDEPENNYQAFLLFVAYFESDKVSADQRSEPAIRSLFTAKKMNTLKEWVNR